MARKPHPAFCSGEIMRFTYTFANGAVLAEYSAAHLVRADEVPPARAVLLGQYDGAVPSSDTGPDPSIEAAHALRERYPPSLPTAEEPGAAQEPVTAPEDSTTAPEDLDDH